MLDSENTGGWHSAFHQLQRQCPTHPQGLWPDGSSKSWLFFLSTDHQKAPGEERQGAYSLVGIDLRHPITLAVSALAVSVSALAVLAKSETYDPDGE